VRASFEFWHLVFWGTLEALPHLKFGLTLLLWRDTNTFFAVVYSGMTIRRAWGPW
jgi:hypothetical protein